MDEKLQSPVSGSIGEEGVEPTDEDGYAQVAAKADLEVQKLKLEIAAGVGEFRIEIDGLKRSQRWDRQVGRFIPIAATFRC